MENFFNVNQAAFILKVHPLTIRRYIREGKLKAVKVGGNIRIKESQLQELHTDVSPRPKWSRSILTKRIPLTKQFRADDPLFRLLGQATSFKLST